MPDTHGMQKPTVGRIVHFHPGKDTQPEAALVIAVYSDTTVKLQVCNAGGTWSTRDSVSFVENAGAAESAAWTWPPRA